MRFFTGCTIALFLLAFSPSARAQSANTQFKPGEWNIQSTVTPSIGKPVQRQISVCAKSASQTWHSDSANQKCTAPTLTNIANGYTIQLQCTGKAGPVNWKSSSNIHETFSNDGSEFQADGTTTTTVSYAGHAPMTSSATLNVTGRRTGDCK